MRRIAPFTAFWLLCVVGLLARAQSPPASQPEAEPQVHWETVARWYGSFHQRAHFAPQREPGAFGASFASPNSVEQTRAHVVIREELSNCGFNRAVVESITWTSSVSDLYYENKDGTRVAAGNGGEGSGHLDESSLVADSSTVAPEAITNSENDLADARREYAEAQRALSAAQEKSQSPRGTASAAATALPMPPPSTEPAVQEYRTALADYEHASTQPSGEHMKVAAQRLNAAQKRYLAYVQDFARTEEAKYRQKLAEYSKKLSDPNLPADQRDALTKQLEEAAQQFAQEMSNITGAGSQHSSGTDTESVADAQRRVDDARHEILVAKTRLEMLRSGTPKASADADADASPSAGDHGAHLQFSINDPSILQYDVDVIPLKQVTFHAELNKDYKPTKHEAGDGHMAFDGMGKLDADGTATLKDTWTSPDGQNHYDWTMRRIPIEQQLVVRGTVLHRIRIPATDSDSSLVRTSSGAVKPSLEGVIPVGGHVTIDTWLIGPGKPPPATQPTRPDAVFSTRGDGTFEFGVPKASGRILRMRFAYYSKAARLWEFDELQVSTNDVTAASVGAGANTAAPLDNIERARTCWFRFGGTPMEYPLGVEHRGATVLRQGKETILQFNGLNSILINLFCLKVPYLNQNNQAFDVRHVAVPAAAILAIRPKFIDEAPIRARLRIPASGPAPDVVHTTVHVGGAVVCYPTCITMVLGALGDAHLAGDGKKSDEVRKWAQQVYDYWSIHAPTRPVAYPHPQPPWMFPFPTDPAPGEAVYAEGERQQASVDPLVRMQANSTFKHAAAPYDHWPFVDAGPADRLKQWLISMPETGYRWLPSTAGDDTDWQLAMTQEPAYRPWQSTDIVLACLADVYHLHGQAHYNTNVFSAAKAPWLIRQLADGRLLTISINHRGSSGSPQPGTHILVVLGVITDNDGAPVRVIVHDPYGDQTLHPGVEGYYDAGKMRDRSVWDKDQPGMPPHGGTFGAYAPYCAGINSYNGSLASNYCITYSRPNPPKAGADMQKLLLESDAWDKDDPAQTD